MLSLVASFLFASSALPTGCPDFIVEKPREAASARVVRAADFGLSTASDKNAAAWIARPIRRPAS